MKLEKLINKPAIVIVGASGHAKVVIDIVEKQDLYHINGLIDTYVETGTRVFEYEVLGTEDILSELYQSKKIIGGIVAIGDNYLRQHMVTQIKKLCPEFQFITAIHPNSIIGKNVSIQEGTVVVAGAVVNCDSMVDSHCIINTRASVGHDCHIKAFSSIASGVILGGNVTINEATAISLGAVILGNITVGKHTVVGAGSVVTKNISNNIMAYGNPAKVIRKRKPSDSYL